MNMEETTPEKIRIRLNDTECIHPNNAKHCHAYEVVLDRSRNETISSFIQYILEEIDPNYDPSEPSINSSCIYGNCKSIDEISKAKLYSFEGIELSDGDLYFLKHKDIIYRLTHHYSNS